MDRFGYWQKIPKYTNLEQIRPSLSHVPWGDIYANVQGGVDPRFIAALGMAESSWGHSGNDPRYLLNYGINTDDPTIYKGNATQIRCASKTLSKYGLTQLNTLDLDYGTIPVDKLHHINFDRMKYADPGNYKDAYNWAGNVASYYHYLVNHPELVPPDPRPLSERLKGISDKGDPPEPSSSGGGSWGSIPAVGWGVGGDAESKNAYKIIAYIIAGLGCIIALVGISKEGK